MHAALIVGHGMNFIHNYSLDIAQDGAAFLRRQQDVERLGRRNQNMRWTLQHEAAVFHQSVARAHGRTNLRHQQPAITCHLQNFSKRDFEIFLNVIAERLERGHVENFGAVARSSGERLASQAGNAGEEGGERFARSSRSRDQRGVSGENVRPALLLRLRRRREARREPLLNQRMSPSQRWRDCGRHGSDCSGNRQLRKTFALKSSKRSVSEILLDKFNYCLYTIDSKWRCLYENSRRRLGSNCPFASRESWEGGLRSKGDCVAYCDREPCRRGSARVRASRLVALRGQQEAQRRALSNALRNSTRSQAIATHWRY